MILSTCISMPELSHTFFMAFVLSTFHKFILSLSLSLSIPLSLPWSLSASPSMRFEDSGRRPF